MDPYKVLRVPKDYTLPQLKKQYKKLLINYHPDVSQDITTTPIFLALTEAYKTLYNKRVREQKEKSHDSLKREYESESKNFNKGNVDVISESNTFNGKFNADKFNKLYEQFAFKDDEEDGYGEWLKSNEDINVTERAIIHRKEPEPLAASKVLGKYAELGKKVKDYTNYDSEIAYMDLRKAHTISRIVDEKSVQMPKQYKNIEQCEADRSKIEYTMSPEEHKKYVAYMAKQKEKEERRLRNIQKKDNQIEDYYNKTHNLVLTHLRG